MGVPGSGRLRMKGDLVSEVRKFGGNTTANLSLRQISEEAGLAAPHAFSELYGYSAAVAPTVTTAGASSTNTTVYITGTVNSDGGAPITERGFYFGTNSSSPTNNTKITLSGTTGNFNTNRTGLSTNSTFYYWSFATNAVGTVYGARQTRATYPTLNYSTGNINGSCGGHLGNEFANDLNDNLTGRIWASSTLYHPYLGGITLNSYDSGYVSYQASSYQTFKYGYYSGGNRGDFRTRVRGDFDYNGGTANDGAYRAYYDSGDGYMASNTSAGIYHGYTTQHTTSKGFASDPVSGKYHNQSQGGMDGSQNAVKFWILNQQYSTQGKSYNGYAYVDYYK